jgi:membrane protease YdiL (CAAX protease family)
VTDALLAQRLAWTAGIVLLGSATEEVVFRGFLLPRLRHATGSWGVAIAISVVAFGIGHLYEGMLATVQTAGIAVMLSLVFLLRRHLMPCIVAHVGFNTLALGLAYLFLQLGLFQRLREILGS